MRKFYALLTIALTLNMFVVSPALASGAWDEIDSLDSYSVGDLNGGSGGSGWGGNWSSNTAYDVTTAATCKSSSKAVSIADNNVANRNSNRTTGGPDSGDLYFCIRGDNATTYADYMYAAFYSGGTFGGEMGLVVNTTSDFRVYADGNGGTPGTVATGLTKSTWYVFNVHFNSCTSWKVRWKAVGGSWSSYTSDITWANSVSCPTTLRFYQGNSGTTKTTFYFDEISTTDPDASSSFKPWQHWLF